MRITYYVSGEGFGRYLSKKETICALGSSNVIRGISKAKESGMCCFRINDVTGEILTYYIEAI